MDIPYSFPRGKKGTYVYRRRVPRDLKARVGSDWWKVSLKTNVPSQARVTATALAADHDAQIAEYRGLTPPQRVLDDVTSLRAANAKDRQDAAAVPQGERRERAALWTARQAAIERLAMGMLAEAEKRLNGLSEGERTMVDASGGLPAFLHETETVGAFNTYLREKAAQNGPCAVLADPDEVISPVEAYQRGEELERERAELAADAKQIRSRQRVLERLDLHSPDAEADDPDNPRIKTVVEQWLKHQGQSLGSARRHRLSWARFRELFGNIPVREVTHAQVLQFRTVCEGIPDTRKLPSKDRDLSLHALSKLTHLPRISSGTVERHLVSIKAMLAWCVGNVPNFGKNVAGGVVAAKDNRRQKDKTRSFTPEELRTVLTRAGQHYDHTRGRDQSRKRDMWWLIHAGAYSGCRLEELCQVARENVREIGGTWVFDINANDGRKLKNEQSERFVPIHPRLVELGFLDFVKEDRGPRVFASFKLQKSSIGMSYGNAASSSFGRFLDRIGLPDPTLKFHSLRHTFISAMRDAEVPYSVELAIAGHHDKVNPVHGRYGSSAKIAVLAKHMTRVDPLA